MSSGVVRVGWKIMVACVVVLFALLAMALDLKRVRHDPDEAPVRSAR